MPSALTAALEGAAAVGAAGLVAIVPEGRPAPSHPALLAAAERVDDGPADDAARDLAAALGPDVLGAAAVAYLGCFAAGAAPARLAEEIAAVARAAGAVVVVEPDALAGPAGGRRRQRGLAVHEHPVGPADGAASGPAR